MAHVIKLKPLARAVNWVRALGRRASIFLATSRVERVHSACALCKCQLKCKVSVYYYTHTRCRLFQCKKCWNGGKWIKLQAPDIVLNVEVIKAEGLRAKDCNGLSDPFCTLYLSNVPTQRYNTSVKSQTLTPSWEEHFSLWVGVGIFEPRVI